MFHWLVLVIALSACVAEEEPQASASPGPTLVRNDHYHRVEQQRLREGLARLRTNLHRVLDRHHDDRHRDDRHRDDRPRNDHFLDDRQRDDHHHDDRHRDGHDDGRWWERRDEHYDREDAEGPVILRSIRPDEHGHTPDIARQNKIIADVYSPDYAEPTWVLDYRYLKTGGRDYTRGPGGQIIILPKGIRTNEHKDFKNYDALIEHLRLKNLAQRKKPQYFMPLGEGARDEDHEELRSPPSHNEEDWWKHH